MVEDKFKLRRRMAKTSFGSIIGLTIAILGMVFFGSPTVATNLQAATPILITLIGCLVGNVSHYSHLVYSSDKGEKDVKLDK